MVQQEPRPGGILSALRRLLFNAVGGMGAFLEAVFLLMQVNRMLQCSGFGEAHRKFVSEIRSRRGRCKGAGRDAIAEVTRAVRIADLFTVSRGHG